MKTSIALACLTLALAVPSIAQADSPASDTVTSSSYAADVVNPQPPPVGASAQDWTAYQNAVMLLGAGG